MLRPVWTHQYVRHHSSNLYDYLLVSGHSTVSDAEVGPTAVGL